MTPLPGTATEEDLIAILDRADKRLCELVDGTLVEKVSSLWESGATALLMVDLFLFLRDHDLGAVFGPDGPMRLSPGLVRLPDVSFVSWKRYPRDRVPLPDVVPDLAVELLNELNTRKEMERKLNDYLRAGVRLVWYIDLEARSVQVFDASGGVRELTEADDLDGGDVLPGFRLSLADWFAEAERTGPKG